MVCRGIESLNGLWRWPESNDGARNGRNGKEGDDGRVPPTRWEATVGGLSSDGRELDSAGEAILAA